MAGDRLGRSARERLRHRIYEILEENRAGDRTALIVGRALMALIVINVLAVVLETVGPLHERYRTAFDIVEWVSVAIFTVEYLVRLWIADDPIASGHEGRWTMRARYALRPSGLIDLAAIAPFYIGFLLPAADLRFLRLFRLVRFLKLARYSPALGSLLNAIASETRALIAAAVIMVGAILSAATALYIVERHVQPEDFGSVPAAAWWAVATLTTVGYGDVVPMTVLGKIIGGCMMIVGLAMFALPVGIVATSFAQEIHRRDFVVTWGMVARVPLFASLNAAGIADVMRLLTARAAEAGEIIVREGDVAHSMFIIGSGRVEVRLPGRTVELTDGAVFGEIAILRQGRRSATIRALERTRLLVLDAADLNRLMEDEPSIASQISAVIAERGGTEALSPGGDMTAEELLPTRHE